MAKCNKVMGAAALLGFSTLFISLTADAANTEFRATIAYEGACDITVPTTIIFNNGDAVLPSDIESGATTAQKTFDLTLADCKGVNVTPKITIAGESNTTTGKPLFLDAAASDATGYGILLATTGNANFKANPNLAETKNISVIDGWDLKTNLTALNGTLPISATLTCGDCKFDGRLGGELKSNVTFEFKYD
ncbi:fimbrial-like protein [Serratia fonticola]|uniref:fimbrial protein n=1 Tax=Serratia fonticola TaxID=47917 RepID=UPI0015C6550F|nr:fimbrial protein [Serratia fonticola]NYA44440.1 fimbrial-like protein [Serratia fonticola]